MTRPLDRNGFGLTFADAEREVQAIEARMILLPDGESCLSRVARELWCSTASRAFRYTMRVWPLS